VKIRLLLRAAGGKSATAGLAVALPLIAAACAGPPARDPAAAHADALGCYDVGLGPWTEMEQDHEVQPTDPPPTDDSLTHVIPPRIQLSDQPPRYSDPDHPSWSAAAPPGALPVGQPDQGWSLDENGRLSLGYGNGLSGFHGTLASIGDSWQGPMEATSDVGGITRWQRQVTLSRVDCASPPPVTDASAWLLPRTVELEGGMILTLGERPPDGLPTYDRPDHAPGVAANTLGLFAGADTVVMVLQDGRVGLIQMTFLPPATPDALLPRLSAAYGEPSVWRWPPSSNETDTLPEAQRPIAGYSWDGRITQIHVSPSGRGGFRIGLSDPRIY
jgi:hypothetical protein